jgi:enoyl-CoA hydratase
MADSVVLDIAESIGTVTLNRPAVRNALSRTMLTLLAQGLLELDRSDAVDVIILTGADPAFCAGLDLDELASGREILRPANPGPGHGPLPAVSKPLIGAINGAAVAGGLEVALACDFLIASNRATFGDTHTRVGVIPGGGLTVMLTQAVGIRRAREMSLTGNFIRADVALQWGLVNHVVDHEALLPFTREVALAITGSDPPAARRLLATYSQVAATTVADGWEIESRNAQDWAGQFDPARVARRRQEILDRGRSQ